MELDPGISQHQSGRTHTVWSTKYRFKVLTGQARLPDAASCKTPHRGNHTKAEIHKWFGLLRKTTRCAARSLHLQKTDYRLCSDHLS